MMMAMDLHQHLATELRQLEFLRMGSMNSLSRKVCWLKFARSGDPPGHRFTSSSRKAATQAGSSPMTGMPAAMSRLEIVQDCAPQPLGRVEHAPVVERAPAAERTRRNGDPPARRLQHLRRGDRRTRPEIVVEGVGPQQHRTAVRIRAAVGGEPVRERCAREWRNAPFLRQCPPIALTRRVQTGRLGERIRQTGSDCATRRPAVDQSHRIGGARPQPPA